MATKKPENIKKFTYGHQFEPGKADLDEYLRLCVEHKPSREKLETALRQKFFSDHSKNTQEDITEDNQKKLAMNCFLSLRNYELIRSTNRAEYEITDIGEELLKCSDNKKQMYGNFAKHILINLSGSDLLRAMENVNKRGENPTLLATITELNEIGYELSKNSIYPSTMRQWLQKAELFDGGSNTNIAWDVYFDLTGIHEDLVGDLYKLNPEQKYFLISMIELNIVDFIEWSKIASHATSIRKLNYDMKLFPVKVLAPLVELGLVEMNKTTEGRGAKPNTVRLTGEAQKEFLLPFIKNIASLVSLDQTELGKKFDAVLNDVAHSDKHIKGKGLELLAIWMIRLCGLRFTQWRKRDFETGDGEVDVMAGSDSFVYSRWQIQCKNTKKVDIDVVAKEIGMTFMTQADVVMIVTTGQFTNSARSYADRLSSISRYYLILIDGNHLNEIKLDRTALIPILDRIAKRTFVKKEYELSDSEYISLIEEEDTSADENSIN
jgi:hypothetical protein